MQSRLKVALSLALLLPLTGATLEAQYRVRYGYGDPSSAGVSLTPYVGYMDMGHYINGPLGTSASGADAGLVGAQLTLPLTPHIAFVANGAHANSTLVFAEPAGGGPTIGNSEVWLFDGDMQLSAPFRGQMGHWVTPFLQFGLGAMRYETQNTAGSAASTNFAWNIGGGIDYSVSRELGLRVLAKDYIGHWSEPVALPYSGDHYTDNFSISAGLVWHL